MSNLITCYRLRNYNLQDLGSTFFPIFAYAQAMFDAVILFPSPEFALVINTIRSSDLFVMS
jgi:hypothetical protein